MVRRLNLSHCHHLSDVAMAALLEKCTLLKDLDITDCNNLTDTSIQALCNCTSMTRLNVRRCTLLSDASIKTLSKHCVLLRYLNIRSCDNITQDCIDFIPNKLPLLFIDYDSIFDHGAFFICKGNEKVVLSIESAIENKPIVYGSTAI